MPLEPETITRNKIYAVWALIIILSCLIIYISIITLPELLIPFAAIAVLLLMLKIWLDESVKNFFDKADAKSSLKLIRTAEKLHRNKYSHDREESLPSSNDEEDNSSTQSLRDLKQLLDDGTITNEEFKKLKKEILD